MISIVSADLGDSGLRIGIPLLGVTLLLYLAVTIVIQFRKLSTFSGRWLAAISDLWLVRAAGTGRMHVKLYEQCKKFPDEDLVRIGPNFLVTTNPKICYHMSSVKAKHWKGKWYAPLKVDPFLNNIFSERDPDRHDVLRKQMIKAFAMKENPQFESKIDRSISGLIDLIERKYLSDASTLRPCDFAEKAQFFSMDVITDVALGQPFDDCRTDNDVHGYITMVGSKLPLVTFCTASGPFVDLIDSAPVKMVAMPSERDKSGQGYIVKMARGIVEARVKANKKETNDMLDLFLRDGMSPRQAISEICTHLLAGSDSTSTSVRAIWLHIISPPPRLHRLAHRIRPRNPQRRRVIPHHRRRDQAPPFPPSLHHGGLPHLAAVHRPPRQGHEPGGENIDGTFVPGGTQIGHCTWGLMRHKLFGDDADCFRPEWWLEAEPARLREMESTVELVFRSGWFLCLGKTLVMIELRKIFVELIRRFECSIVNPAEPWTSGNYTVSAVQHVVSL